MKVRIKSGVSHRVGPDQVAQAGDVIEVSEDELVSFGDKFEVVTDDKPEESEARVSSAKGRGKQQ